MPHVVHTATVNASSATTASSAGTTCVNTAISSDATACTIAWIRNVMILKMAKIGKTSRLSYAA